MTRAVLAEAREIVLLMSMLLGLSGLSLAVACGAVIVADNQAQNAAARTAPTAITSLGR
jgi:flagellar basal body P-ring protein FlgI